MSFTAAPNDEQSGISGIDLPSNPENEGYQEGQTIDELKQTGEVESDIVSGTHSDMSFTYAAPNDEQSGISGIDLPSNTENEGYEHRHIELKQTGEVESDIVSGIHSDMSITAAPHEVQSGISGIDLPSNAQNEGYQEGQKTAELKQTDAVRSYTVSETHSEMSFTTAPRGEHSGISGIDLPSNSENEGYQHRHIDWKQTGEVTSNTVSETNSNVFGRSELENQSFDIMSKSQQALSNEWSDEHFNAVYMVAARGSLSPSNFATLQSQLASREDIGSDKKSTNYEEISSSSHINIFTKPKSRMGMLNLLEVSISENQDLEKQKPEFRESEPTESHLESIYIEQSTDRQSVGEDTSDIANGVHSKKLFTAESKEMQSSIISGTDLQSDSENKVYKEERQELDEDSTEDSRYNIRSEIHSTLSNERESVPRRSSDTNPNVTLPDFLTELEGIQSSPNFGERLENLILVSDQNLDSIAQSLDLPRESRSSGEYTQLKAGATSEVYVLVTDSMIRQNHMASSEDQYKMGGSASALGSGVHSTTSFYTPFQDDLAASREQDFVVTDIDVSRYASLSSPYMSDKLDLNSSTDVWKTQSQKAVARSVTTIEVSGESNDSSLYVPLQSDLAASKEFSAGLWPTHSAVFNESPRETSHVTPYLPLTNNMASPGHITSAESSAVGPSQSGAYGGWHLSGGNISKRTSTANPYTQLETDLATNRRIGSHKGSSVRPQHLPPDVKHYGSHVHVFRASATSSPYVIWQEDLVRNTELGSARKSAILPGISGTSGQYHNGRDKTFNEHTDRNILSPYVPLRSDLVTSKQYSSTDIWPTYSSNIVNVMNVEVPRESTNHYVPVKSDLVTSRELSSTNVWPTHSEITTSVTDDKIPAESTTPYVHSRSDFVIYKEVSSTDAVPTHSANTLNALNIEGPRESATPYVPVKSDLITSNTLSSTDILLTHSPIPKSVTDDTGTEKSTDHYVIVNSDLVTSKEFSSNNICPTRSLITNSVMNHEGPRGNTSPHDLVNSNVVTSKEFSSPEIWLTHSPIAGNVTNYEQPRGSSDHYVPVKSDLVTSKEFSSTDVWPIQSPIYRSETNAEVPGRSTSPYVPLKLDLATFKEFSSTKVWQTHSPVTGRDATGEGPRDSTSPYVPVKSDLVTSKEFSSSDKWPTYLPINRSIINDEGAISVTNVEVPVRSTSPYVPVKSDLVTSKELTKTDVWSSHLLIANVVTTDEAPEGAISPYTPIKSDLIIANELSSNDTSSTYSQITKSVTNEYVLPRSSQTSPFVPAKSDFITSIGFSSIDSPLSRSVKLVDGPRGNTSSYVSVKSDLVTSKEFSITDVRSAHSSVTGIVTNDEFPEGSISPYTITKSDLLITKEMSTADIWPTNSQIPRSITNDIVFRGSSKTSPYVPAILEIKISNEFSSTDFSTTHSSIARISNMEALRSGKTSLHVPIKSEFATSEEFSSTGAWQTHSPGTGRVANGEGPRGRVQLPVKSNSWCRKIYKSHSVVTEQASGHYSTVLKFS